VNNRMKVGILFAALIGGWHVLWAALVLVGWAQPILDFVFWAHMIRRVYVVSGFDPKASITLIVLSAGVGFVFGYAGVLIWRKLR
jgi:hypothetical protein